MEEKGQKRRRGEEGKWREKDGRRMEEKARAGPILLFVPSH